MGKFSDSPYFLLKDFFLGKGDIYNLASTRPIIDYEWPVIWTDRDYVIFEDRPGVVWNLRYYYDPNAPTTDGSYLVGLETNIVAKGDGIMELWIKETEEPYKQYLPVTLRWKRLEDNNFVFTDSDLHNLLSGPSASMLSGARYWFIDYDTTDTDYADIINNDREVYFRKDSIYHEWLTNSEMAPGYYPIVRGHETDIRNYVNSDKIFSYFGNIYNYVQKNSDKDLNQINEFRIIFDGLKDYTMRAIPEHQRTPKFREFMEIFFDRKWHEIYNQIKNIWTLIDPMEVDQDFLGYLSLYYYMKDLLSPTLFRQREFVRDLIWLLKRKGTYVQFYIIWRAVANTINALNIYEKWHEKDIINGIHTTYGVPSAAAGDTHVYPAEWQEYIYVEKPEYRYSAPIGGAGKGWYNRSYGLSGESIINTESPSGFYNYPVKINANTTAGDPEYGGTPNSDIPLPIYQETDDRILSTHYKVEIDVSTEPLLPDAIVDQDLWEELYEYWEYLRPVNRVVDYNILIAPITDFSGCFISLYEESPDAYDLTRTLVDLRTPTGWIEPFTEPTSGCMAYYTTALSASSAAASACHWIIDHELDTKYLHTMAVDIEFNQIIPKEIEIVSKSRVIMHWDRPVVGYGLLKKAHTFNIGGNPSTGIWNIYHYLKTNEVVLESHDITIDDSHWKYYNNDVDNTGLSAADYATLDSDGVVTSLVPASSGEYVYIQPLGEESGVWNVPHHLFYRGVITAVYDWNHKQIHQYEFKLTHIDECVLEFDEETYPDGVSGYAVFLPVANFSFDDLIEEFIRLVTLPGAHWKGAENLGDLSNDNFVASGSMEPNEIYQDDEYIYINVRLGTTIEGSFREWGIYDPNGNILVYSKNSEIYKPSGTTLVLHFRLEKTVGSLCGSGVAGGQGSFETCP